MKKIILISSFFSSFTLLSSIFALHFWYLFLKCSVAQLALLQVFQYYILYFPFFLYFPFLISRHNVLSCLAHYWTLILSENFWLTEFLIALHCSWPLFQNVKFMQFPLVDLIGKWDSSWFGPKSENADLISVITHTHRAHTIRSKKIFKLLMLLLLNLMYKVSERFCESKNGYLSLWFKSLYINQWAD